MRVLAGFIVASAIASSAHATCLRYFAPDLEGALLSFERYIVCLHEEQVRAINQHAELIDKLRSETSSLSELSSSTMRLTHSVDDLANANSRVIDKLSAEHLALERRVKELEAQIKLLKPRNPYLDLAD